MVGVMDRLYLYRLILVPWLLFVSTAPAAYESTSHTRFGRDYVKQLIEDPIPPSTKRPLQTCNVCTPLCGWSDGPHGCLGRGPVDKTLEIAQMEMYPQTNWPEGEGKYRVYGVCVYSRLRY